MVRNRERQQLPENAAISAAGQGNEYFFRTEPSQLLTDIVRLFDPTGGRPAERHPPSLKAAVMGRHFTSGVSCDMIKPFRIAAALREVQQLP